ncbi:MAG: amino acid ABC transporter substrate-binding protein [Anaerolineae bacterium]|jgi:general L-amino acid transport system substrate-binding protein|nr:amino acid ABC transporter substrate-binding protein [Anaerolineae bacterium]MBT7070856.1 amino acid ABC transporter substrate-binding protein [Anaerolineae bacterium]MBT7324360.1 amino acid ABC transporter substrate-binding protein [Anaerolineae bacterium]
MSRKLFPVFALLIVLSMVLAACGGAAAPEAPAEEAAAVEAPAEEAAAAPGETEGPAPAASGDTLATVQARGHVICGGNSGVPGFGFLDTEGTFTGFDIDFCKAVAAAVFGDAEAYEIRPLSSQERFTALQSGEIDVLIRNTTWTLSRDTDLGANFVATTFYDGQGFIVRKADGINTLEDLDGGTVCVQTGTTTEANLADTMAARGLSYEPVVYEDVETGWTTYEEGRCDAYTTDKSGLVARQILLTVPDDHVIMDETISKEPLGPVVRHGDDQWFDIVQWTVFATFFAEEHGITAANAGDMMASTANPREKSFFGTEGELGAFLGLDADWAYNVVSQVGNYAEIYDRNLGPDTLTYIPRGLNSLYTDGGLLFAPAWR